MSHNPCHSPEKKRGGYNDIQEQLSGKGSPTIFFFVILTTSVKKTKWYLQTVSFGAEYFSKTFQNDIPGSTVFKKRKIFIFQGNSKEFTLFFTSTALP